MVTIKGKIFDIGMLENGRGIKVETDGEEVEIIGLSHSECKELSMLLGEQIIIKIESYNEPAKGRAESASSD